MNNSYDLSDIASSEENYGNHDLSDIGATQEESPIPNETASQNILNQVKQFQNKKSSLLDFIVPKYARNDLRNIAGYSLLASPISEPYLATKGLNYLPGLISGSIRSAGRIGTGTGQAALSSSIMHDQGTFKERNIEGFKEAFPIMAAVEGLSTPFRLVGGISEFLNPLKETKSEINNIQNNYKSALNEQKNYYKKANDKYGEFKITENPKEYLDFNKSQLRRFTPDVNKSYYDFLEDPTFENLHKLQSQMGKDWSKIANNSNKINTAQNLKISRESIKDKIQSFLSRDPEALESYNNGSEITKNIIEPYKSNILLRKIIKGKINETLPNKLVNAIQKGNEKEIGSIPNNHYLQKSLSNLTGKINRGKLLTDIPLIGRAFNSISDIAQNPYLISKLSQLNKPYYTIGKLISGLSSDNFYGNGSLNNLLSKNEK